MGVLVLVSALSEARGDDEFHGWLSLRGGYDSNPIFAPDGRGTALGGVNGGLIAGRATETYVAAFSAEAGYTRYRETVDAPVQQYKAAFDVANADQSEIALKSTTSAAHFSNYDTRSFDLIERVRAQKTGGAVQPFAVIEARYSELNESNILFGDFLPEPQKFLRGTIIPGVAVKGEGFEIGASLNMSATRYEHEFDDFGLRRDNERIEPFLFARLRREKFSLFASLSRLYGDWRDPAFSDVRKNLFEATLAYEGDTAGFDLSAKRSAEETTFPFSPIAIDTTYSGRIRKKLDTATWFGVFARHFEKRYLDSPYLQRTVSYGAQLTRDLSDQTSVGFELYRSAMRPIFGENVDGVVAMASFTQRFGDRKRAEGEGSAR